MYAVPYEAVNAMLLNEFLKEHNAFVEEQYKVEQMQEANWSAYDSRAESQRSTRTEQIQTAHG